MGGTLIGVLNAVICGIGNALSFVVGLFPDSVLQDTSFLPVLDSEVIKIINAFFPVYEILYFLEGFLFCLISYYSVSVIARFVKLIH